MSAAPILLERVAALIQQSVRADAARFGLLPMHVQLLAYLARANHYSDMPIAIADYFGVTRGTVSQAGTEAPRDQVRGRTPRQTRASESDRAGKAARIRG